MEDVLVVARELALRTLLKSMFKHEIFLWRLYTTQFFLVTLEKLEPCRYSWACSQSPCSPPFLKLIEFLVTLFWKAGLNKITCFAESKFFYACFFFSLHYLWAFHVCSLNCSVVPSSFGFILLNRGILEVRYLTGEDTNLLSISHGQNGNIYLGGSCSALTGWDS